jgi:DNA-binding CsgD family transcriptional regulator
MITLKERIELLPPRQREVLEYALAGASTHWISMAMGISPKTVKVTKTVILRKLDMVGQGNILEIVLRLAEEKRAGEVRK